MTAREDLVRLVPPPLRTVAVPNWEAVEARLGVRLPGDYKWLIERYGPGSFGFLQVLLPESSIENVRLEHQAKQTAEGLDYLRESGMDIPYQNAELLPFAGTNNGDFCYWLRHPADDPDAWTVVVGERSAGPEWSTFDGGVVEFLYAVLSGRHQVSVFPEDFPSEEPTFEPYDDEI
jgi:hypothetical protein